MDDREAMQVHWDRISELAATLKPVTAAQIDRYKTFKAAREMYGPKPDLCPNCKAEKSAWGRHGCDHSKWGPGVPDFRGLPELYRRWTPRGVARKRVSGARQAIARFAFKVDRVKVAVNGIDVSEGFVADDYIDTLKRNELAVLNALRLPAHLVGGPGACETCGEKTGSTRVRLCGDCEIAQYKRRCYRIEKHARLASRGERSSAELFKILCVHFLTRDGATRPIAGLAQDVLTKFCLMGPGLERDRIRRQLFGEVG